MRYDELKRMMESGDLEQIRPYLAFEMIAEDSPKQELYKQLPAYCNSGYECDANGVGRV